MRYRATATIWVGEKLIFPDLGPESEFTSKGKPGSAWEPLDDEARAAVEATPPKPVNGETILVSASVPVDWRAEAVKAGWQAPGARYEAAPPASAPAAPAPVVAPVAPVPVAPVEPVKPVEDDGAI